MVDDASTRFSGVIVPMITPFTDGGSIDLSAVDRLVDHLLEGGSDAIFVLGTTGESASIERPMKQVLVQRVAHRLAGKATLLAGVSSTALGESLEMAQAWKSLGADAVVAHPPGYFPVPASAIESHMCRIADRVELPLILYDIPKVTHCEIAVDAIVRLAEHPRVAGLKDSTGNEARLQALIDALAGRPDFSLCLGSAPLFGRFLRNGGPGIAGIVPSSANLEPGLYRDMMNASRRKDDASLGALDARSIALGHIYQANMTLGESLARLKAQLAARGLCTSNVLPPLSRQD